MDGNHSLEAVRELFGSFVIIGETATQKNLGYLQGGNDPADLRVYVVF